MQTASGTAESDVSGVYMNMVTKSGGNRFTVDHNFYFMNDSLQGNNIDDDLRARLGLQPGQQSGAAGNPIDICYDWSSTLGGPIQRDKAVVLRRDPLVAARPVPDRRAQPRRIAGHRRQPHPQLRRQGHLAGDAERSRPRSCSTATSTTASTAATRRTCSSRTRRPCCRTSRRRTTWRSTTTWSAAQHGGRRALRPDVGHLPRALPGRGAAHRHRHPRRRALHAHQRAPRRSRSTPTTATRATSPAATSSTRPAPARHDLKAGVQFSRERRASTSASATATPASSCSDGVPLPGAALEHADQLRPPACRPGASSCRTAGCVGRAHRSTPACASTASAPTCRRSRARPAPSSASAASPRPTSSTSAPTSRRASASPTTCSATADGDQGLLRPLLQPVRLADRRGRQPQRDRQPGGGVDRPQRQPSRSIPASSAPSPASRAACSRPSTDDASRPYSDEINVGVEQQLAGNLARVGVSYHRRQHRDGLGILDRARGRRRLHADRAHLHRPGAARRSRSPSTTCGRSSSPRATATSATSTFLKSNYDGVQFDFQKRMSNRWQMLAGAQLPAPPRLRPQRHLTPKRRLQQPELVDQPRRRLGVHRPAVDGHAVGQLPAAVRLHGLGQVHRPRRRPAEPHTRHVHRPDRVAGQRDHPRWRSAAPTAPRTSPSSSTCASRKRFAHRLARASRAPSTCSTCSTPTTCCCRTRSSARPGGRPTRILTPRIIRFGVTARSKAGALGTRGSGLGRRALARTTVIRRAAPFWAALRLDRYVAWGSRPGRLP